MRSDIYTATAMSNDADDALQEAVQTLWRSAVAQHRDRFVVSSLTHAATLVTTAEEVVPKLARRPSSYGTGGLSGGPYDHRAAERGAAHTAVV